MTRAFPNILCPDPAELAPFYETLLGWTRRGDFGFFLLLGPEEESAIELGLLQQDHETVPESARAGRGGLILTFVVSEVDPLLPVAESLGAKIIEPPTDLFYGQRRLLLRDPVGTLVDLSAPY